MDYPREIEVNAAFTFNPTSYLYFWLHTLACTTQGVNGPFRAVGCVFPSIARMYQSVVPEGVPLPEGWETFMELHSEIDRLMKRLENRVAEPEVVFAAVKQLVASRFGTALPQDITAFNHFMDMSLQRRLSGPGLAVLINEVKARVSDLHASLPKPRAVERPVHWV